MQPWIRFTATFGYLGQSPWAPGTVGTIGAIPFAYLLMLAGAEAYVFSTLLFCVFSIFVAQSFENASDNHDSKEIVIDEVAGYLVTMTLLPMTWQSFLLGFVLFRFFDVLKPFPIRFFDKNVGGGFGVVADDLVAGLMANVILQGLLGYYPFVFGV
tara:strand:+ start:33491 stop:33958 length:468 start_codon:yes stop_codon:yes gene_type:complete